MPHFELQNFNVCEGVGEIKLRQKILEGVTEGVCVWEREKVCEREKECVFTLIYNFQTYKYSVVTLWSTYVLCGSSVREKIGVCVSVCVCVCQGVCVWETEIERERVEKSRDGKRGQNMTNHIIYHSSRTQTRETVIFRKMKCRQTDSQTDKITNRQKKTCTIVERNSKSNAIKNCKYVNTNKQTDKK